MAKDKKVLGYKIRHSKTNLFLSSPYKMKWTKVGKTWPRMCDVVRTINYGTRYYKYRIEEDEKSYDTYINDLVNWEVVELTESNKYPIAFIMDKLK